MHSSFRASLRSKAQTLDPVVMVGHGGISDGVISALEEALTSHELVKVRFQDFKDQVKILAGELANATASDLVATTGFTAVYYRKNDAKSADLTKKSLY